jgi:uncharacterized protein (TIGR03435 family)
MIVRTVEVALFACGFSFGQVVFEVASIRPAAPVEFGRTSVRRTIVKENALEGRLNYQGVSLTDLIGDAYRVQHRQISGPDWLSSQRFDILAVIPAARSNDQISQMLEALLRERFNLKTHEETKEEKVYRLFVVNSGANLEKAERESGISGRSTKTVERVNARTTLASFAEYLSERLDRPVLDQTALTGVYSIRLEWMPDTAAAAGADAAGPSIFTAVQEQLGLRLVAAKTSVQLLIVDHIEKYPTDN